MINTSENIFFLCKIEEEQLLSKQYFKRTTFDFPKIKGEIQIIQSLL